MIHHGIITEFIVEVSFGVYGIYRSKYLLYNSNSNANTVISSSLELKRLSLP
jgi:hypothetical protein